MPGLGDRLTGGPAPPGLGLGDRLRWALEAAASMQEPSRALYEAKHRRAQGLPPETSFLEDLASLGSRAVGGAQKMWQMAPSAAGALWNDPLGSVNRAGQAGQAATDAIVRGAAQPFAQFGDPNIDPVKQAVDLTGSVMLGSAAIPAETNALRMGIKAYHGSPHDFERFDASKIGTGEGAQAYGHGLYFAEREGVAADYRNKLGRPNFLTTKSGTPVSSDMQRLLDEGYDDAVNIGGVRGPSANDAIFMARKRLDQQRADALKAGDFDWFNKVSDQISELSRIEKDVPTTKGKMYEVDIAAEPEQFLDFDAPISAQPQHAQDLLQSLHKYTVKQDGKTWRVLHPGGWVPNAAKNFYRSEDAARQAAEQLNQSRTVQDLVPRNPEQVAPFREAGIPGIRYLDQGSRAAGEGSRNYVIFPGNEKLVSILKKYGLPISAAGLAALSQLHPEEAQAAQAGLGERLQQGR